MPQGQKRVLAGARRGTEEAGGWKPGAAAAVWGEFWLRRAAHLASTSPTAAAAETPSTTERCTIMCLVPSYSGCSSMPCCVDANTAPPRQAVQVLMAPEVTPRLSGSHTDKADLSIGTVDDRSMGRIVGLRCQLEAGSTACRSSTSFRQKLSASP